MPISIPAFLTYLAFTASARAQFQVSAPNCTDSDFGWTSNSLQQNPSVVAAYLEVMCNNGVFDLPTLLPQESYLGPNGTDDNNVCKCNMIVYNLISTCDACQGESWITFLAWSSICTIPASLGTFPEPVPLSREYPFGPTSTLPYSVTPGTS